MLLTVDLGNTNLKLAVYEEGQRLCFNTFDSRQSDYAPLIMNFLYRANLKEDYIEDAIVSSVVPSLNPSLFQAIRKVTGKEPIVIGPRNCYGIGMNTANIDEIGSDLLVMCAYGYHKYHCELLVISIGTATVISHVTAEGVFRHCVIAPGYTKIAETLYGNAAKLPEFNICRRSSFLADNTIDAMNVGLYQGYIGSLRYLLAGLRGELNSNPKVIACGGFGKEVVEDIKEIEYYEADMVTSGLAYIYYDYIKNETHTR